MKFNDIDSYCLSINQDRYDELSRVFKKVGLKTPTLFKGHRFKNGAGGCTFGHVAIVLMAKTLDLPYVAIFEDDAYPRPDVLELLDLSLSDLPDDWGLLILGSTSFSNYLKNKPHTVLKYGKWIKRFAESTHGSHSYIIRKECYDFFLDSLSETFADVALSSRYFPNYYSQYMFEDNLFVQRNIDFNCLTNYANLFSKEYCFKENEYIFFCYGEHKDGFDLLLQMAYPENFKDL